MSNSGKESIGRTKQYIINSKPVDNSPNFYEEHLKELTPEKASFTRKKSSRKRAARNTKKSSRKRTARKMKKSSRK